jgi:hypothetical protein
MLWSLALAGAGTALVSPFVTEVLMFGVFPSAFACIGSTHQDYRFRRGSGGTLTAAREAATSQFPYVVTPRVFSGRGVVSFGAAVGGDTWCFVFRTQSGSVVICTCVLRALAQEWTHDRLDATVFLCFCADVSCGAVQYVYASTTCRFVALLSGSQSWSALLAELKHVNAVSALVLWSAMMIKRRAR